MELATQDGGLWLMKTPIIVLERETREILLFSTLPQAESYMEAPDIDIYEVFDAEGEIYSLTASSEFGCVVARPTGKKDLARVSGFLRAQISSLGLIEPSADSSINGLISVLQAAGYRNPL